MIDEVKTRTEIQTAWIEHRIWNLIEVLNGIGKPEPFSEDSLIREHARSGAVQGAAFSIAKFLQRHEEQLRETKP